MLLRHFLSIQTAEIFMARVLAAVLVLFLATRVTTDLTGEWKFIKSDEAGAEKSEFEDAAWEKITVPHTWNNKDGQDGGNNFYKGACWYRRHVTIEKIEGKVAYLRF